jgi:protein phosphatase 1 regulatory subunit 7
MRETRITDPDSIRPDELRSRHEAGEEVIVQFSKPCYSVAMLGQLNELCRHFEDRFKVRFYGHYKEGFDCASLQHLPSVRSLSIDSLQAVHNHEAIFLLKNLREFHVGIFLLDFPRFFEAENLRKLRTLFIGETKKKNFDLSLLSKYLQLDRLLIAGHTKNIEAVGSLKSLSWLSLNAVSSSAKLGFVNSLDGLRSLDLILGGRKNINEIEHPRLERLRVIRVLGFDAFDAAKFPQLQELQIEDQIRLNALEFSSTNGELRRILLLNCKELISVSGLRILPRLYEIRIAMTGVDIDELLSAGLPQTLQIFAFYTRKSIVDRNIRKRLDELGYGEFKVAVLG